MTAVAPLPFQIGFRLEDGQDLNRYFGYPVYSVEDSITASTTQTQAAAYQLTAQISRVTTVATSGNGVALVTANVGKSVAVINASANAMQVFGRNGTTDTINGTAGSTGVSQPANTMYIYTCTMAGAWTSMSGSNTITGTLTYSSSTKVGTFVVNGVTPVTVANTSITANSMIFYALKTVGGTVGAIPHTATITPGTGFTVVGTASDTSTYFYMVVESA